MKLAILTAMHARHELNEIFCSAMGRIRANYNAQTYVALSHNDDKNLRLCMFWGFPTIVTKNNPVSNKFNKGLSLLRDEDWTHVMILGSDDIPSNKFIEIQMQSARDHDISMISDMWFWGLNPKRAGFDKFYYFPGGSSRIGAGRVISRRVIEACNYTIWPDDKNAGLDSGSLARMRNTVPDVRMSAVNLRDAGGFLVDVKYELHISSLSPIERIGEEVDNDIIWEHLPPGECQSLLNLRAKVKGDEKE